MIRLILVWNIFTFVIIHQAYACNCRQVTPEEAFKISALVFSGKVTKISDPFHVDHASLPSGVRSIQFEVDVSWKGVETSTIRIENPHEYNTCSYPFEVGETYLVYAYEGFGGQPYLTNLCTRTARLQDAGEDLEYLGEGVSVETESFKLRSRHKLNQNFPNPLINHTIIYYYLHSPSYVSLNIYDVSGRQVFTVLNGASRTAGQHNESLNLSTLPSGRYFYELRTEQGSERKCMIIAR